MKEVDELLGESINYTYVQCSPSRDDGANEKNRKLVKNLKKKVKEMREIIAIQETEIETLKSQKISTKNSTKVKQLMQEITILRQ